MVRNAVESGYRLIDTASSYQNEEAVGRAVQNLRRPAGGAVYYDKGVYPGNGL